MIQQWSTRREQFMYRFHAIRNTETALSINCLDRYFTQDKPFRTFIECSTITPLLQLRYRRIGQMNESVRPSRRAEEIEEAVNNRVSRSHGQQCRLYKRSRELTHSSTSTSLYHLPVPGISSKQSLPQYSRWAVLSDIN